MRKLYIIILLLFSLTVNAQEKLQEIGVFLGTSYYMGELNQSKVFYQPSEALSVLYKVNLNDRFAIRMNASYAHLKGDDAVSDHKYQINRNHKFDINITEFSALVEFNFFEYQPYSQYDYFSFYFTCGIGAMMMPEADNKSPINPVIPFGIGFKYAVTKRLGLGIEWIYRKTFTDYIDQLPQQVYTEVPRQKNKQLTNNLNNDWYSFAGITLTYKFALGNTKCAAYD